MSRIATRGSKKLSCTQAEHNNRSTRGQGERKRHSTGLEHDTTIRKPIDEAPDCCISCLPAR